MSCVSKLIKKSLTLQSNNEEHHRGVDKVIIITSKLLEVQKYPNAFESEY